MNELKRCPFCGNEGKLRYRDKTETYIVECSCPSCIIHWIETKYDSKEEAMMYWNDRY